MIVIFETSESYYFNLEVTLKIKMKKKKKKKKFPKPPWQNLFNTRTVFMLESWVWSRNSKNQKQLKPENDVFTKIFEGIEIS